MLYVIKNIELNNKNIKVYKIIIDNTCYVFINKFY